MTGIYRKPLKKQKQSFGQKPGCISKELKQNEALTPNAVFGFITDPIYGDEFYLCTLY